MSAKNNQLSLLNPVLDTKLYIPEIKSERVRRKRLVDRLNGGIDNRLILISAPAGFGKTTLLCEWISQGTTPAAWISIDSSDNDPLCFIQYMIAALRRIEPDFASALLGILRALHQLTTDSIMLSLIKEIETLPFRFILVLDDYHLINTRKINGIVELLLDRMPQQMCLAIASRADPGFPFARLRVTNQLTEIRISDLYFTREETALFFEQVMRLNLKENEIDRLITRTEGWVAGLQLAALSIKGQKDVPAFIENFAGSDRLVADYLTEEVLHRRTEDIQNFLLKTSILHRLSASLCECVTRQKTCQAILEDLEQDNLFLVPLDNKRQWYRYHHLFADLLRQRLLRNDRDMVNQLHLRASDWYEANGYPEEAIDHSLSAKDFKRAADLIERMLEDSWQGGEQATILNWLKMLPDQIIDSYPNLCLSYGIILFENGQPDLAEDCLNRLDELISANHEENPDSDGGLPVSEIQGRIAAQRTYWATFKGDLDSMALYSQQALDHLNKNDDAWRVMVYIGSAISYEVKGDVDAALKMHYEAVRSAQRSGSVYYFMYTRLWLDIVLKTFGQLPKAMDICQQLLSEVNGGALTFNIAIGHTLGTWGEMIYERNELEESYTYAQKGVAILEEGHDIHSIGWRYACLGKILCSRRDINPARALVPKMDALLAAGAIPPWIASEIEAVRARIWLMEKHFKAIEHWVEQNMIEPEGGLNRFYESNYIELARTLIHLDRCDDAEKIISPLLIKLEKEGRGLPLMESLMIQTRIFQIKNRINDAIDTLAKAISIAAPGNYLRVFADEGQFVSDLLRKFPDSKKEKQRQFIMTFQAEVEKGKAVKHSHGLVEPLSEREMDVLRLISAGLPNKKTAETLFISVNTLKTHLQNIYGKLGVHNRTEAVFRAKEVGLLD